MLVHILLLFFIVHLCLCILSTFVVVELSDLKKEWFVFCFSESNTAIIYCDTCKDHPWGKPDNYSKHYCLFTVCVCACMRVCVHMCVKFFKTIFSMCQDAIANNVIKHPVFC